MFYIEFYVWLLYNELHDFYLAYYSRIFSISTIRRLRIIHYQISWEMTSSCIKCFQKSWIVKCCPLIKHTWLQPFSICLGLFRNHWRHGCFAMITEIHTMSLGFENYQHQIIRQLFVTIPLLLKKSLYKSNAGQTKYVK